jgi:hypothetical protein
MIGSHGVKSIFLRYHPKLSLLVLACRGGLCRRFQSYRMSLKPLRLPLAVGEPIQDRLGVSWLSAAWIARPLSRCGA